MMFFVFLFETAWMMLKMKQFWVLTLICILVGLAVCLNNGVWIHMLFFSASPFLALIVTSLVLAAIFSAAYYDGLNNMD